MAKPVHPAAVHFPIAFLMLANGLDLATYFYAYLPNFLASSLPSANEAAKASYYLLSLALVSSIPAVITGGGEAMKMIQKSGMYDKDGSIRTKVKVTIAHAIVNDVVIAANTYIWYQRRAAIKGSLSQKAGLDLAAAYAPQNWMVAAEGLITVLLLMGANMGGNLTYVFGVGLGGGNSVVPKKLQ